ncbi:Ig-like domain-containing protein [Halobacillus sp. BBL2006]|uniref:Ig-like domain-containing protein n=1 Tax=Halobacillus sp. BBL2006 TaxID=1543706 RepID=UPI000689C9DC|nr:Ig-like domain-containing protein [Halobacillus sp. BBL2006]
MSVNLEETFELSEGAVQLTELPLENSSVMVTDMNGLIDFSEVEGAPAEEEFNVNYDSGTILFNSANNGLKVRVKYTADPYQYFNYQNTIKKYENGEAVEIYTYQYNYPVPESSDGNIRNNFNPYGEPLHTHEIEDINLLQDHLDQQADLDHTHEEFYTKEEVNQKINEALEDCCPENEIPVIGISLGQSQLMARKGETLQLVATIEPENATNKDIIWSSSNESVASVDSNGLVSLINDGQVVIAATSVEGGYSDTVNIIVETPVLYYNFRNRSGSTNNTIYDEVSQLPATLNGVSHDGTYGFVNELGLTLNASSYVTVPTTDSSLSYDMNDDGMTFIISLYNPNSSFFKTGSFKVVSFFINGFLYAYFRYLDKNGVENSLLMSDESGRKVNTSTIERYTNAILDNEENVFIVTIRSNGTAQMYLNGYVSEVNTANNFAQWVNTIKSENLLLRRNHVNANSSTTILSSFEIIDHSLSEEEMLSKDSSIKKNETLRGFDVVPSNVSLLAGESQPLAIKTYPGYYNNLVSIDYESGNEGLVIVDEQGVLTGVLDGETQITVTMEYLGKKFFDYVEVSVGETSIEPPNPNRTLEGISLNRITKSIKVGQEYPLMATTLPFDVFDSNYIIWETSNAAVASVPYGILQGHSEGTATITAFDPTRTFSKSFNVSVSILEEELIEESQIYYVPINQFNISNDLTDSISTTDGIQEVFNFASSNGYRKIVFPQGNYLITPDARTLLPPSNMVVEWNHSNIQIEPSSKTYSGYTMFYYDQDVNDCKFINGKFYGEAKQTTLEQSVESCLTFHIKESNQCSWENCSFNESPGFNFITGTNVRKLGTESTSVGLNWEQGKINSDGSNSSTPTSNTWRYRDYLDITGLGSYYMVGYNQGYYSYPYLRSRLYTIFFYDINKSFISHQEYNLQFFNYEKPVNAVFVRLVIYQENAPDTLDTDFGAIVFIRTVGMPRFCEIVNCRFEDNFSTGLALTGGEGWLIDSCTFSNNSNGRTPACDVDWEDGWETMQGDVFRNNTVTSRNGVILSAGNSIALHNNTFDQSHLQVYSRTNNFRIFANTFYGPGNRPHALAAQAESYFCRNILLDGASYSTSLHHPSADYRINTENNTII